MMLERMESRKKKEFEVARVLDLQCERQKNEKAISKVKEAKLGAAVIEDVKLHELEEQRVKKERYEKNLKHKQELERLMEQRTKISEYISTNQAFHDQKAAKQAAQAAKAANADE